MRGHSIFWKILAAFLVFAACLSLGLGVFIYLAADRLGRFLVEEQVKPAMVALIEAERQASRPASWQAASLKIAEIAAAINADFKSRDEVPAEIASLASGLHFGKSGFVYVRRVGGNIYSLSGSSRALRHFLDRIAGLCAMAGILGLGAAFGVAWLLSVRLARPMIRLAASILPGSQLEPSVPPELTQREDEIGMVASAVSRYQLEAREFLEREAAFAGYVSHELRTGLAVLGGALELLEARNPEPDPLLKRMERTLARMAATVAALLCLARKAPGLEAQIDLYKMMKDLIAQIVSYGCEFRLTGTEQAFVTAQPELVQIALRNLLENACCYSADGIIDIHISPDSLEILNVVAYADKFESGLRQGQPESIQMERCKNAGAGLGLPLAKRACERLGWVLAINIDECRVTAEIAYSGSVTREFIENTHKTRKANGQSHRN